MPIFLGANDFQRPHVTLTSSSMSSIKDIQSWSVTSPCPEIMSSREGMACLWITVFYEHGSWVRSSHPPPSGDTLWTCPGHPEGCIRGNMHDCSPIYCPQALGKAICGWGVPKRVPRMQHLHSGWAEWWEVHKGTKLSVLSHCLPHCSSVVNRERLPGPCTQ